ncbi:MAG: PepSY-associated TM helix domain-containing protein [Acidobacteriaceae bacterium]|nr:PepSY-associated TM helix domain-containing protein [Acidobacteriaceae bacterium]
MGLFKNLLHHPRRVWARRMVFQVHLWSGVLLSLYLVLISLSGALMVYHDALTTSTLPQNLRPYDAAKIASVPSVMQAAQAAFPNAAVSSLTLPSARLPVFQVQVQREDGSSFQAIADPQSGAVRRLSRSWVDVVYEFHIELLLGDAHGMQWNGIGAAGLLLLAVTGVLLWWRGMARWWRGLGVSFRTNWRRINYDLHHALGIWTLFLVSWWAVSGVYFAWDKPFTAVVNRISPLVGMREPEAAALRPEVVGGTLQAMLERAQQASPHGRLSTLTNPSLAAGEPLTAYMNLRSPEDFAHADIVTLDPRSGAVLSVWHYGENHSVGDWLLWALEPLHFGTLWGPWMRAAWCVFGVALAVLTITGLLMYWNRFLRFRWRALTQHPA